MQVLIEPSRYLAEFEPETKADEPVIPMPRPLTRPEQRAMLEQARLTPLQALGIEA